MLFCLCGFHATVAYSSLGLINMLYAVSLTLGVAGWRVRFRRPRVLAHCDVVRGVYVIQLGRLVGL